MIVVIRSEQEEDVYRIRDGLIETVVRSDEPLPGGGRFTGQIWLNHEGTLLIRAEGEGETFFYLWEGQAPRLWIQFDGILDAQQLDFRRDHGIVYRTLEEVQTIDLSGTVRTLAKISDPVRPGFIVRLVRWARMLSDGRVVFMVNDYWSNGLNQDALCISEGEGFRVLTSTGDSIPETGTTVAGLYSERTSSTIRINGRDEIMLQADTTINTNPGSQRVFLLVEPSGRVSQILPRPDLRPSDAEFVEIMFGSFIWGDSGELYFQVLTRERPPETAGNLFVWQDGSLFRIVGEGDSVLPEREPGIGLVESLGEPLVAAGGEVFFRMDLVGDAQTGLYRALSGDHSRQWIPRVAVGDFGAVHYTSTLLVHNPGDRVVTTNVTLLGAEPGVSGQSLEIGPGEVARLSYDSSDVFLGWASVESEGGPVQVYERLTMTLNGVLGSEVTVPAVRPLREGYWIGDVDRDSAVDTGLAVVSTGRTSSEVSVALLSSGLEVEQTAALVLQAGGVQAVLLSDLFPSLSPGRHLLRVSSGQPFSAISLLLRGVDITSSPILGVNRFLGVSGVIGR